MNFHKHSRNVVHIVLFLFFNGLGGSLTAYEPVTINQAHNYATSIALPQKPDNNNLFYPEYSLWYRKQAPAWFDFLWKKVSTSPWEIANYKALFEAVIKQLDTKNACSPHVVQIDHKPGDILTIIGDLQGAIISCVNDLLELQKLGVLATDLTIKKQNYQIILNGNVIGREPLNLQLLALIGSLMLKNPGRIWYIRGAYEETDWWEHGPLGQQLASLHEDGAILKSLIERWFSLLPYALYVNYENGEKVIRISAYSRDFEKINERMFGSFFDAPLKQHNAYYCLNNKVLAKKIPHIKAMIYSNDGIESFVQNKGLALLDFTGGSIAWSVFSAPTVLQRAINDFHYDTFVMLELGKTFAESAMSLYSRDMMNNKPFMVERFVLQTGHSIRLNEKIVPQQNQIMLGSSLDLSKGASANGRALKTGLSVCVNNYNRDEKITKKSIELIIRDNEYNPMLTRENVEELHKEGINTVIMLHGSPTLRSVMDKMEDSSMLFLFPTSGATIFRSPNLPGVIHYKASYRDQAFALIPHLIEKQYIKRFVFFYQDDSFGLSGMEAAREILPYYGIKEWTEIPYVRNITDMKMVAEKIKQTQPEALGLFSTAAATIELIKQLGTETAMNVTLFGLDTLCESLFVKFAKKIGLRPFLCHSVPDPETSNLPIVQDYRKAMSAASKAYGDFSLEAYIGASLFVYALQNIKGPFNHVTVRTFFEQIKNYDFKGLHLNFDPLSRSLCHEVWMGDGNGPLIQKTSPELEFHKKQFRP